MATNIQVAVRVRPFNKRERGLGSTQVLDMTGERTTIVNPGDEEERHKFDFDYCFWSHGRDSGKVYADQDFIFEKLGKTLVGNALEGFNVSLFAYGQTGSGKSYSMMGAPGAPGMIPRGCEEIFRIVDTNDIPDLTYEVEVSYLEIYNEVVRDLLESDAKKEERVKRSRGRDKGLRIRQDRKRGIFVEGLSRHAVDTFEDVTRLMDLGFKSRTVAATKMNATSSRSHTIYTLHLTQSKKTGDEINTTTSKINLIDLAGSERQAKTGATGQRFKEAQAINQSLSALGNVISALSDGKKHVPYRDSVLTRLLQESLGGNAKTIMIAALSPAGDNYDETLSTLRYASRVKKITNSVKKNVQKSRAEVEKDLNDRISELEEMLKNQRDSGAPAAPIADADEDASVSSEELDELREELEEQKEELRRTALTHNQKLDEMRSYRDETSGRLKKLGIADLVGADVDLSMPRLVNLSQDPAASGSLMYFITSDLCRIGTMDADEECDIVLLSNAKSILPKHAEIITAAPENDGVASQLSVRKACAEAEVFVNGKPVPEGEDVALSHGDRIILGRNLVFQFVHPGGGIGADGEQPSLPDFDFEATKTELQDANKELQDLRDEIMGVRDVLATQKNAVVRALKHLMAQTDEANVLAAELVKGVQYSVVHLPVFDVENDVETILLMVKEEYSASDPNIVRYIYADEFDELLDVQQLYYDCYLEAGDKGHAVCAERFDDDPFLPDFTDTLLGEARGVCVRQSNDQDTRVNIADRNGDLVGTAVIRVQMYQATQVDVSDDTNEDCDPASRAGMSLVKGDAEAKINQSMNIEVTVSEIELQAPSKGVHCSFCCFGPIMNIIPPGSPDTSSTHHFKQKILLHVQSVTPGILKFVRETGFVVQMWAEVFSDASELPPSMFQKLQSAQQRSNEYMKQALMSKVRADALKSRLQVQKDTHDEEIETLKSEIKFLQQENAALRLSKDEIVEIRRVHESDLNVANAATQASKDELTECQKQIKELQSENEKLKTESEDLKNKKSARKKSGNDGSVSGGAPDSRGTPSSTKEQGDKCCSLQ